MKTNYLQKNKNQPRRKKIKQTIFIIVLFLILIVAGSFVRGTVHFFNLPIIAVQKVIVQPINLLFHYFISKDRLADQNAILSEENKKLKIELLTVNSLREENEELKKIVGYNEKISKYTPAKVLNKPPVSPFDTFVIDITDDETKIGQKVYYESLPIGFIFEVYENSSVVKLYSSSSEKIPVNIGEEIKNVPARGINDGNFVIEIPKDITIEKGEMVTLSTGEIIGVVDGVLTENSNTFQNVYFKYPFSLNDINWVLVSN